MDENTFSALVSEAIDAIPEPYQTHMQNIAFKVEAEPTPQQRERLGLRQCDALFGLYEGVPLTRRGGQTHSLVPDIITIFMEPMVSIYKDEDSLKKQIYKTVWHEVAHYYGLDHARIHALERKAAS